MSFLDEGVLPGLWNGAAAVPEVRQAPHLGPGPPGWEGGDEAVSLEMK